MHHHHITRALSAAIGVVCAVGMLAPQAFAQPTDSATSALSSALSATAGAGQLATAQSAAKLNAQDAQQSQADAAIKAAQAQEQAAPSKQPQAPAEQSGRAAGSASANAQLGSQQNPIRLPNAQHNPLDAKISLMVTLKDQPQAPGAAQGAHVSEQNALIQSWKAKYGVLVGRQFSYLVNAFVVQASPRDVPAMAADPRVASIKRETVYYPLQATGAGNNNNANTAANAAANTAALQAVAKPLENSARNAEGVPTAFHNYGADGTGMVVAVIDTGIDPSHQDMRLDNCSKAKIRSINAAPDAHFTCKVPNGYNYADNNFKVKDTAGAEQHGMHVAGIIAAHGSDDLTKAPAAGRINGVAPNAQVLAMKVFSNDPARAKGAQDADIIAAIEDSVKLHADVINMSLGSPNGVRDTSVGTFRAIKMAREAGVFVVVSAGNSGRNFSLSGETDTIAPNRLDDGTVGSPAVQDASFSVASINNPFKKQPAMSVQIPGATGADAAKKFPYSVVTSKIDDKPHRLTYVGLGRPTDYKDNGGKLQDLKGTYALVERGEITFSAKWAEAIKHHADGIIIYNHAHGGEELIGVGGVIAKSFPGMTLYHSAGEFLKAQLKQHPDLTVTFSAEPSDWPSVYAMQPSNFTSWGATSQLDFSPQIAGIGGDVYSTQNGNKYVSMSGTSMAAPNLSGLVALTLQKYAQTYANKPIAERMRLAREALMNTAQIPMHDGVPYAPRQIGAGLARVDRALKTRVLATVKDAATGAQLPSVALREIHGATQFTVKLTNTSDKPAKYAVPAQQVIKEVDALGKPSVTKIADDESLEAAAQSVEVPAHGTASVSFTLHPNATAPAHFTQGWARFEALSADDDDLAVPYLGFVGDWNAENIIQAPKQPWATSDKLHAMDNPLKTTNLVTSSAMLGLLIVGFGNDENHLVPSGDPNAAAAMMNAASGAQPQAPQPTAYPGVWLSPNGDGEADSTAAMLLFMRNAAEVKYSLEDEHGNTLRELGSSLDMSRVGGEIVTNPARGSLLVQPGMEFDGKIYDPATGKDKPLPDGKYRYAVQGCLSKQGDPHQYPCQKKIEFPFGVDTVAPVISTEAHALKDGKYTFKVTDQGSGLWMTPTVMDSKNNPLTVTDNHDGTFSVPVSDPKDTGYLVIQARDHGLNSTQVAEILTGNDMVLVEGPYQHGKVLARGQWNVDKDGVLTFYGLVTPRVKRVTLNGVDATIKDGIFTSKVKLHDGENKLTAIAYDEQGNKLVERSTTVQFDNVPPTISDLKYPGAPGDLELDLKGEATISGKVSDNRSNANLMVLIDGRPTPVKPDGTFSAKVHVNPRSWSVNITVMDGANTTQKAIKVKGRKEVVPYRGINVYNIGCDNGGRGECHTTNPADLSKDAQGNSIYTLHGSGEPGAQVVVVARPTVGADGQYAPALEFAATVGADGTFALPVRFNEGSNVFRLIVKDAKGKERQSRLVHFMLDTIYPSIAFSQPTLVGNTLYADKPEVTFSGVVSDNGHGYVLSLNRSDFLQVNYENGLGPQSNERKFNHTVKVKDGDTLLLTLADMADRKLEARIPVVLDQQAPVVNEAAVTHEGLTGALLANQLLDHGDTLHFSAQDKHLHALHVQINGVNQEPEIIEKATELSSPTGFNTVESALTKLPVPTFGAAGGAGAAGHAVGKVTANAAAKAAQAADTGTAAGATDNGSANNGENHSTNSPNGSGNSAEGSKSDNDKPKPTSNVEDKLSIDVPLKGKALGFYTVTVDAVDLAGNTATRTFSFTIDALPKIAGKPEATLKVCAKDLLDQKALTRELLKQYHVDDDGVVIGSAAFPAPATPDTLELAPNTVLHQGKQQVLLVAEDMLGRTEYKLITVNITAESCAPAPKPTSPLLGGGEGGNGGNGENAGNCTTDGSCNSGNGGDSCTSNCGGEGVEPDTFYDPFEGFGNLPADPFHHSEETPRKDPRENPRENPQNPRGGVQGELKGKPQGELQGEPQGEPQQDQLGAQQGGKPAGDHSDKQGAERITGAFTPQRGLAGSEGGKRAHPRGAAQQPEQQAALAATGSDNAVIMLLSVALAALALVAQFAYYRRRFAEAVAE